MFFLKSQNTYVYIMYINNNKIKFFFAKVSNKIKG